MFPELRNAIGFENSPKYCMNFVGVCEENTNGSFVIHHLLSYFLKQERPVCFVALAQSLNHFHTIAMKNGVNLKENKNLLFIEGLKLIGQNIYENAFVDNEEENKVFNLFDKNQEVSLENFYKYIKDTCRDFFTGKKEGVIIFDDLSVLSVLGVKHKDIVLLVEHLNFLCQKSSYLSSLVILVDSGIASGDEELKYIWKHIQHSCNTSIEVCGLKTGYCRDVHGEIKIWKATAMPRKHETTTFQFKILDKNVALFASGLSSAVL